MVGRNRKQRQAEELQREDTALPPTAGAAAGPSEEKRWDGPAFRHKVLWNLLFVAAPAIIMALLGVYWLAALWFVVGVLMIVWDGWRQVRDFWRWLIGRSKR